MIAVPTVRPAAAVPAGVILGLAVDVDAGRRESQARYAERVVVILGETPAGDRDGRQRRRDSETLRRAGPAPASIAAAAIRMAGHAGRMPNPDASVSGRKPARAEPRAAARSARDDAARFAARGRIDADRARSGPLSVSAFDMGTLDDASDGTPTFDMGTLNEPRDGTSTFDMGIL